MNIDRTKRTETSNFQTYETALRYYKNNRAEVDRMIASGEIVIGRPANVNGKAYEVTKEGRYILIG